ncbi:MAG: hypothetical protein FK732_08465 [Asgard group archaeon]|nr:hypothetical protein [Asgard group archaeon]
MTPYFEPRVEIIEKKDSKLFDKIATRLQLDGYVVLGEKFKKSKDVKSEQTLQKITRIEIKENKVEKIRSLLPKIRNQYELVSVNTTSAKAAQWVVKDDRVDILTIPYKSSKEIITDNFANVAANSKTFIEIDLSFLLKETEKSPSVKMRTLTRIMNILIRENAPFVLTTDVRNPLDFRDERSIIALGQLVGIPPKSTKENMIKFQERIKLNQSKLKPEFVTPGIRKVAEKKQEKKKSSPKKTVLLEEIPFHLKDLPIEKMKLERQRYILFEILQLESTKVELDGLIDLLWKQFTKFYGEVGSSRIGLYVIKFNPEKNIGIIRCNQDSLSALRAMLATITKKEKAKVLFHIMKVSGTLKNLLQIHKKKSGN